MFGREKKIEVFVTNDPELHTTVHQALKAAQIPCEVKIVNTGTQNRWVGTLIDRVGEQPKLEVQYCVYTPREHAERVKYIIDEYRKSLSR